MYISEAMSEQQQQMQDKLISNEKIILLIYDRIFHNDFKKSTISEKDMILDLWSFLY